MPQVLSMTPKQGESPDDFAARVGEQVSQFFKPTGPAAEVTDTPTDAPADAPTDVPADTEEPAPSA